MFTNCILYMLLFCNYDMNNINFLKLYIHTQLGSKHAFVSDLVISFVDLCASVKSWDLISSSILYYGAKFCEVFSLIPRTQILWGLPNCYNRVCKSACAVKQIIHLNMIHKTSIKHSTGNLTLISKTKIAQKINTKTGECNQKGNRRAIMRSGCFMELMGNVQADPFFYPQELLFSSALES